MFYRGIFQGRRSSFREKSRIRETQSLLTDADSSTDTFCSADLNQEIADWGQVLIKETEFWWLSGTHFLLQVMDLFRVFVNGHITSILWLVLNGGFIFGFEFFRNMNLRGTVEYYYTLFILDEGECPKPIASTRQKWCKSNLSCGNVLCGKLSGQD